ncbi:MAG: SCO family protein [Gammaproteobacteria bacterium]|nr:SCO family protein [Gammaproteobacteria bacterium]
MKHLYSLVSIFFLLAFSSSSMAAKPLEFTLNQLVDGKAQKVTPKTWENKYLLIAVGYTTCPDICPTTLLDMRMAMAELDKTPEKVKKVQPLFITIDPTSDSLEAITQYTSYFDPRIIGLRASNFTELDDVVSKLRASYGYEFNDKPVVPPNLPKGYTVMHSTFIYLYSPEGQLLDAYQYNLNGTEMARRISKHLP